MFIGPNDGSDSSLFSSGNILKQKKEKWKTLFC
jgi:hypothetical protein